MLTHPLLLQLPLSPPSQVKVCKQASLKLVTYRETAQRVIREDGVAGLLGRGLGTKLVANGIQGMTFGESRASQSSPLRAQPAI